MSIRLELLLSTPALRALLVVTRHGLSALLACCVVLTPVEDCLVEGGLIACAVWEMYTGASLFKGLTVGQVFFMVVYEAHRPAIPEDCPEPFVKLMTSCWSADPADRYTHDLSEML